MEEVLFHIAVDEYKHTVVPEKGVRGISHHSLGWGEHWCTGQVQREVFMILNHVKIGMPGNMEQQYYQPWLFRSSGPPSSSHQRSFFLNPSLTVTLILSQGCLPIHPDIKSEHRFLPQWCPVLLPFIQRDLTNLGHCNNIVLGLAANTSSL